MRVAITGATGSIGHALIAECIKQNIEVVAICRKESQRAPLLFSEVAKMISVEEQKVKEMLHIWYLGLDEYQSVEMSDSTCDIFYHLAWNGTVGAARNDEAMQMKNASYALDAVRLAKKMGCHTFVGAGSQAEYGRVEGKLTATTATNPENEYGKAKLAAGKATRELCNELGIKHIWTRILSVYGPYDTATSMVMSAITQIVNNEVPKFTKGEQEWDFLYSADAAKALLLIGIKGVDGKIYPVGCGMTKPLAEYIKTLRDMVNPDAKIDLGAVPYGEKQVMYLCADITELTKDTGFEPETDFAEGIREILKQQYS